MTVDELPKIRLFTCEKRVNLYLIKICNNKSSAMNAAIELRNWGYHARVTQCIRTQPNGR